MKNLKTKNANILLIGIGNSGRKDDGLGWKFVELVSQIGIRDIDCEYRYQLQIEDVLMICNYDKVIFADASHKELKEGFEWQSCSVAPHYFFSSHLQSPETILYLSKELYNKTPETYTLAIAGYSWGLGTNLSEEAELNLQKAFSFFEKELMLVASNET
jgi:hydrogenase maturation protease